MSENAEAVARLFERLQAEFTNGGMIIQVIVQELGDMRVTFPSVKDLYRMERNRCIVAEFNGGNLAELGFKYRLTPRQVRNIVLAEK
ncbi:MAG TPA: hypothetical protein DCZ63_08545 [Geobacter sp.]|nr:hypothetical protein [Geobacter sp.]